MQKILYYPLVRKLFEILKTVDSPQGGITRSINLANLDRFLPRFFSLAADMSDIHKLVGIEQDVQYHVSGYGLFYEEAFIRVISEAIERYCLMLYPHILEKEIIFASYLELQRRGEDLPPFEYYNLFADSDYLRDGLHYLSKPSPDHIIGWIKGNSLMNNKELLIPAQMALPGYKINSEMGEKRWVIGFSTGAASGVTYEDALLSALTEVIEIDSFNIHWYTERKGDQISLDGSILDSIIKDLFNQTDFVPKILYHSLPDVKIHTMSTFLINKKGLMPAISVGSQSSLDPIHCAYRSIAEAIAVSFLGILGYVYQPLLFTSENDHTSIGNLDTNVAFYSRPENYELGKKIIDNLTGASIMNLNELPNLLQNDNKGNLVYLVKEILKVSRYGAAINISTPDVKSLGFHVVKAFIPELMFMSLPSYPYRNHPRMKKYGGVKNKYPHPIP